jgi:flagellar biogenesis protein FliO
MIELILFFALALFLAVTWAVMFYSFSPSVKGLFSDKMKKIRRL